MSSATNSSLGKTAAWRISLWGTAAFALGAIVLFAFLHQFVAHEIQRRSDSWLTGEVEVLGDVAERTPPGRLYDRIVREVAELATKEVPHERESATESNQSVFFLQTTPSGEIGVWVGKGDAQNVWKAIQQKRIVSGSPVDINITGFRHPFRVATGKMDNGDSIYLGLSARDESRVLHRLRLYFLLLCLGIVLMGFLIIFFSTRRMLGRVQQITDTAAKVGENDLCARVPTIPGNDEISHLAFTLNKMLDRIENSVNQLHTITDSLAHDLRSPVTAIRGKLEAALLAADDHNWADPVASAIDDLDRLCELLTKSLDVAEAHANALRLHKEPVDLDELLRIMVDLYEPGMLEHGISVTFSSTEQVFVSADPGLIHRMMANIFDNELKHLTPGRSVQIRLSGSNDMCEILVEDNGPGFPPEVLSQMFDKYAKGNNSEGFGLGLAFVAAVVRAHDGSIEAVNAASEGISLRIMLPLVVQCGSRENTLG